MSHIQTNRFMRLFNCALPLFRVGISEIAAKSYPVTAEIE